MAILEIPIDTQQPDHRFYLELERVVYLFHFRLNSRSNRWMMSLYSESGDLLAGGIPLVINFPLIGRFKREDLPPGEIYLLDMTESSQEPTSESFGTTHTLVYEESTDE